MDQKISRDTIYKFLDRVIDKHPGDAIGLLKDIIVCNCVLPEGDEEQMISMSEIDQAVAVFMSQGNKIGAVKFVREQMQCGLKEAKDYVEGKNWPSTVMNQQVRDRQHQWAKAWMEKVQKDYCVE